MLKLFVTLARGRSHDAAEAVTTAQALPILRQQLRDCAKGVDAARRSVALVMAYAEREKATSARIMRDLADLESRALDALAKGRDDLATDAATAIAQLEQERDATAHAIHIYETEITRLRRILSDSETRLRDLQRGQRLAVATDQTQRLRKTAPQSATNGLEDAEAMLKRLQDHQAETAATELAMIELSAPTHAAAIRDRLAAQGCGTPLRPDAASVLARLKARAA